MLNVTVGQVYQKMGFRISLFLSFEAQWLEIVWASGVY